MIYLTLYNFHLKFNFHCFVLRDEMNKIRYFFIFRPVKFVLAQLASSPYFSLPSGTSPLTDVVIPLHRVMLPFHGVKTSSLALLHLSATLRLLHPLSS
jgi:hypothetical protein